MTSSNDTINSLWSTNVHLFHLQLISSEVVLYLGVIELVKETASRKNDKETKILKPFCGNVKGHRKQLENNTNWELLRERML